MNYVKQAYELSADKKLSAVEIYKQAVKEFVNKNYLRLCEDAHVDLSAIFGQRWLMKHRGGGAFWLDAALYTEANVAFNYANLTIGIENRFIDTAKEVVSKQDRLSDKQLKLLAAQMNCLLTATTVKKTQQEIFF